MDQAQEKNIEEEKILFNIPTAFIQLGEKQYGLKRLTIRKSREWRQKFESLLSTQKKAQSADGLTLGLELTGELTAQLADIVAAYLGDVTAGDIEETADEKQLIDAFMAVVRHSRVPFEQLGQV